MKRRITAFAIAICTAVTLLAPLRVDAVTDEEREIFSALGLSAALDENGMFNADAIRGDYVMPSGRDVTEIAKKYEGQTVGNYLIKPKFADDGMVHQLRIDFIDEGNFRVVNVCSLFSNIAIFQDVNNNYTQLNFYHPCTGETTANVTTMITGKYIPEEEIPAGEISFDGWDEYKKWSKNEKGEFVAKSSQTRDELCEYDADGNLIRKLDRKTDIYYDADGNPTHKVVWAPSANSAIFSGLSRAIPIAIYDDMEKLANEQGGFFVPDERFAGGYRFNDDINTQISNYIVAQKVGVSDDDYKEHREEYDAALEALEDEDGDAGISAKAQVFGGDMTDLYAHPLPCGEDDIPEGITKEGIAEEFMRILNEYRKENGLSPLGTDSILLGKVADIRAEECTYYFHHDRPVIGTEAVFHVGENIAYCTLGSMMTSEEVARAVFESWKKSPGHNENMLTEYYREGSLGVAFAYGEHGPEIYFSNNFSDYKPSYDEAVDIRIKDRISQGAQIPEAYKNGTGDGGGEGLSSSAKIPDGGYFYIDEDRMNRSGTGTMGGYSVATTEVYDTSGNKFRLPNGFEWNNATFDAHPAGDGCYEGTIVFNGAGSQWCCLVISKFVTEMAKDDVTVITCKNDVRNANRIVLAPTGEAIMGDFHYINLASDTMYYITNGSAIEYNYEKDTSRDIDISNIKLPTGSDSVPEGYYEDDWGNLWSMDDFNRDFEDE